METSRRKCLLAAAIVALPPVRSRGSRPDSGAPLGVPRLFRVADCGGDAVRGEPWVREHLGAAQAILKGAGLELDSTMRPFSPPTCDLLDRAARDAMALHAAPGPEVTVLVVRRVRDLDVPAYDLMGVHWRYGGGDPAWKGRRWVFLTARAEPPVLAHELCHFFGLPHDPGGGNLMTPGPSSPAWKSPRPPRPFEPRLTRGQARALRAGVKAWLAQSA